MPAPGDNRFLWQENAAQGIVQRGQFAAFPSGLSGHKGI